MIVIDVETTGNDPRIHSIVSIGAYDFTRQREFYGECRIWEGAQISMKDLAKNGFTPEQLADPGRLSQQHLLSNFHAWAWYSPERTLVAQHPSFDVAGFLQTTYERYRMSWIFGYRTIDVHTLCWAHMARTGRVPGPVNRLSGLHSDLISAYVGLPPEPKPHHGLNGAKWEAEAVSRLVYARNELPQFARYPLPDHLLAPIGGTL